MLEKQGKKYQQQILRRFKGLLRGMGLILFILSLIFIVGFFLLSSSRIQDWSKNQLLVYLSTKIQNKFELGQVEIDLFHGGVISNLIIYDHHHDTLLYAAKVNVNFKKDLSSLFKNELSISDVILDQGVFKIISYQGEEYNSLNWFIKHISKTKSSSASNPFKFSLQSVLLKSFHHYRDRQGSGIKEHYYVSTGEIEVNKLDFNANYLELKNVKTNHAVVEIKHYAVQPLAPKKIISIAQDTSYYCSNPFIVYCHHAEVEESSFYLNKSMTNEDLDTSMPYVDFNHFFVNHINTKLQSFLFNDLNFEGQLKSFNAKINNQFNIQSFSVGQFNVNDKKASIEQFVLKTDHSWIRDSLYLSYSKYTDFKSFNDKIYIDHYAHDARIAILDIQYFSKALSSNKFFITNRDESLNYSGRVLGKINGLKFIDFTANIGTEFEFKGDISSRNLTKKGNELLNIRINKLKTSLPFLSTIIPGLKMPDLYNKIGKFQFVGAFDGYFEDFVSYGLFETELGNVRSDLRLNLRPGKEKATFSGSISLEHFALGSLLNIKDLKEVSLKAQIRNGTGLTIDKLSADLEANFQSISFRHYIYRNASFNGKVNQNLLDGEVKIKDTNLDLVFNGKLSNLKDNPSFVFDMKINKADLKALNLTQESYIVSTDISSDFKSLELDKVRGEIKLEKAMIYDYAKNRILNLGSLSINQNRKDAKSHLVIDSDPIHVDLLGDYKLKSLFNVIMTHFDHNYHDVLSTIKIPFEEDHSIADFNLSIQGKSINRIFLFFDIPIKLNTVNLELTHDGINNVQNIKGDLPELIVNDIKFVNGNINLVSKNSVLNSQFNFEAIYFKQDKLFASISISPKIENNKLSTTLFAMDSTGIKPSYDLGFIIDFFSDHKLVYMDRNALLIQGLQWFVNPEAKLDLFEKGFKITNFEVSDTIRSIRVEDINQSGIKLIAENFNLSFLNTFIYNKSVRMEGFFNSEIIVPSLKTLKDITGQISISNYRINTNNYGRINLAFELKDPYKPLEITIENNYKECYLTGQGTLNLPLVSNYTLPKFDFHFDFKTSGFPISFLENFMTSISNTKGTLQGNMSLDFKDKILTSNGVLEAQRGSTKINYLNTEYTFDKEEVIFKGDEFVFKNTTIFDELKNPIAVNGIIRHENFKRFFMDVNIAAKQALVLNTRKGDNIYYYGYGILDFVSTFKGPTWSMDMNIIGKSKKGSKLVIPMRYDQDAGDTKFVRFKHKNANEFIATKVNQSIKGLSVKMNIEITEEAEISIVFDELTGDILRSNGRGNLQIAALRDNTFTIKGNYEVVQGQYLFTLFNFVNKPFKLKRGGTILWSGDPLDADINLEASYEGLNVSPLILLQEYLTTDAQREEARRRTKVDLTMILTGSLLKPDINFRLGFPELTGTLKNLSENKVRELEQNPDELNQQVAALVALRTFIGAKDVGVGSIGKTTINTMSEFLSNQLSVFVSSLLSEAFEGVDFISGIDVNVLYDQADATSLTQSTGNDVAVNFQSRLWDDKLAVTLGGNYNSAPTTLKSNYFNPETVIEWNTPIPGLKLRVYYKGVDSIEGVKHKVGSGITYRKEFDSLGDFKNGIKNQRDNRKNKKL